MWKWKKKQVVDERIQKESNRLNAKMFYLLTALVFGLLIVKLCAKAPLLVYLLEVITLVAGGIYFVAAEVKKGIFLVKDKDEVIKTLHEQNLSKAMYLEFSILVFGELVYLFLRMVSLSRKVFCEYLHWLQCGDFCSISYL